MPNVDDVIEVSELDLVSQEVVQNIRERNVSLGSLDLWAWPTTGPSLLWQLGAVGVLVLLGVLAPDWVLGLTIPGFEEFPEDQLLNIFIGDFPRLAWAGTELTTLDERGVMAAFVEALHADIREARTLLFVTTARPIQAPKK